MRIPLATCTVYTWLIGRVSTVTGIVDTRPIVEFFVVIARQSALFQQLPPSLKLGLSLLPILPSQHGLCRINSFLVNHLLLNWIYPISRCQMHNVQRCLAHSWTFVQISFSSTHHASPFPPCHFEKEKLLHALYVYQVCNKSGHIALDYYQQPSKGFPSQHASTNSFSTARCWLALVSWLWGLSSHHLWFSQPQSEG
jgi:hypothetical protein